MIEVNVNQCIGCSFCTPICPNDAISCLGIALINDELCVDCGECVEYCPNSALIFIAARKESAVGQ